MRVNKGTDMHAAALGGDVAGDTGFSSGNLTGTGSVTLPDTTKSWATNQFVGHWAAIVDRTSHAVYKGIIASNTATGFTVLQWEALDTDVASTPTTTDTYDYVILAGNAPARIMALSTDTVAVNATDTTLPSEVTTNGLAAKRGTYAHTASATSYSLSATWTCTGGSTTIGKVGIRQTILTSGNCFFQTLLSTTATLANTDQLTVTDTVSL